MIWTALGEYRGPLQARAFVRYAANVQRGDFEELSFRAFVTDCVGAFVGASNRWADAVIRQEEYDAQSVVDDVISRSGLEVIG